MVYVRRPFAEDAADRVIPEFDTQVSNVVSFQAGYPVQYEQDPNTVGTARRIERDEFNGLLFLITSELRRLQQQGIPDFITAAENGGSAFAYSVGAIVRFDPGSGVRIYQSVASANNTTPPGANWRDITDALTALTATATSGLAVSGSGASRALALNFNNMTSLLLANVQAGDSFAVYASDAGIMEHRRITLTVLRQAIINADAASLINALTIDADSLGGVAATNYVRHDAVNAIGNALVIRTAGEGFRADTNSATEDPAYGLFKNGVASGFLRYIDNASGAFGAVQLVNQIGNSDILIVDDDEFHFRQNGLIEFLMQSDGDFHADGDVISQSTTTTSDRKLKTDINYLNDLENSLHIINALMPTEYRWKPSDKNPNRERDLKLGFIAQDVQQVIPEAITEREDRLNKLGGDGKGTYLTLEVMPIIVHLVNSVKALSDRVNLLERLLRE